MYSYAYKARSYTEHMHEGPRGVFLFELLLCFTSTPPLCSLANGHSFFPDQATCVAGAVGLVEASFGNLTGFVRSTYQ